ncbi:MAG: hypothetical protein ACPGVO_01625 [Spirulinaceae cyanobacterium]
MLRSTSKSLGKLAAIAALTLLLPASLSPLAQAQGRTAADWSDAEKQTFLAGCQNRANPPGVSDNEIPAYCRCVLNRLVRDQVPLADINSATQNPNPDRWTPSFRRAVMSCLR